MAKAGFILIYFGISIVHKIIWPSARSTRSFKFTHVVCADLRWRCDFRVSTNLEGTKGNAERASAL